jgi:3-ketosteroid 9alpha-monooxygenase subunit A
MGSEMRLNMKPTGWFQIGWSAEIPPGGVKPMKYFGQDLVAFRTLDGRLSVLDAHCHHLGAHLGHGGKVEGDCVVCPYHGWQWNTEGVNAKIPYQDKPVDKRLRKWHVAEKNELIFLWHDEAGRPPLPGWDLIDIFTGIPEHPGSADGFYTTWPHGTIDKPDEPTHPQIVVENNADCMHFRYTHGAPEDPQMLWFEYDGPVWRSAVGFTSPRTKRIALTTHSINLGIGVNYTVFHSSKMHYRLVLTATPIDDTRTYQRVSYWFQRPPGAPPEMPEDVLAQARHMDFLFEQDAMIWRHQRYVDSPVLAAQDVMAYTALRRWSQQFYDNSPAPKPQSRQVLVETEAAA